MYRDLTFAFFLFILFIAEYFIILSLFNDGSLFEPRFLIRTLKALLNKIMSNFIRWTLYLFSFILVYMTFHEEVHVLIKIKHYQISEQLLFLIISNIYFSIILSKQSRKNRNWTGSAIHPDHLRTNTVDNTNFSPFPIFRHTFDLPNEYSVSNSNVDSILNNLYKWDTTQVALLREGLRDNRKIPSYIK
jgi:hypothetical protein